MGSGGGEEGGREREVEGGRGECEGWTPCCRYWAIIVESS